MFLINPYCTGTATVEVDERRLAQCIRSLVSGAIALTPKVRAQMYTYTNTCIHTYIHTLFCYY